MDLIPFSLQEYCDCSSLEAALRGACGGGVCLSHAPAFRLHVLFIVNSQIYLH
jgi:hypothetical protein